MTTIIKRLLRKPEARAPFGVGKTKFEEDIVPLLDKVFVGPRAVAFTEESVARVLDQLIAASAERNATAPNSATPRNFVMSARRKSDTHMRTMRRGRRRTSARP